ncbi:MAG: hypothetical protein ACRAS9_02060 [Mycoplasma sp.]
MKNLPTITRTGLILNAIWGFILFIFIIPLIMGIWSVYILGKNKSVSTGYLVLSFFCCSILGFILILIGQTIEEQSDRQKVCVNE